MGFFQFLTLLEVIFLVYLFIAVSNIRDQLKSLPQGKKVPQAVENKEVIVEKEEVGRVNTGSSDDPITKFFKWFARDWPLKVGAIFVLLGIGWFLTYAFMNNIIGPTGRLVLGLVTGSVVMLLGNLRIKKNMYQGEILATLGAGILLTTIFASEHMYANLIRNLYPQWVSLVLVTLVIAALTFTSYRYKTMRLAALAFLIGAVAPFIVHYSGTDIIGIFSYLLALTIGLIWLVRRTGWRILILLPLGTVIIYTLLYGFAFHLTPDEKLWMKFFSITFTSIFYLSSLVSLGYEKTRSEYDPFVGVLLSVYSFLWILLYITSQNRSLVFATFAIIFMMGSYLLRKLKSTDDGVYLYFIVSIVFLVIATFVQIKEPEYLSIALSVEALLLLIFTDRMYSVKSTMFAAFLFIPPVLISLQLFQAYSQYSSNPLMYLHYGYQGGTYSELTNRRVYDLQLILIGFMLYAGAFYSYLYSQRKEIKQVGKLLLLGSVIYSLYYVWQAVPYHLKSVNFGYDGKMVVLIIMALVGLASYFYGIGETKVWTKRFGLILSLFVIGRLLLVEIWSMPIEAKIITFILVGVIFMLSVFVQFSMHEKNK